MPRIQHFAIFTALLLLLAAGAIAGPPRDAESEEEPRENASLASLPGPEVVSFPSGSLTLKGYLYKPAGPGPFPAMVWNHGSDHMREPGNPTPADRRGFAHWYVQHGFVVFLPHRRGHGLSPGDWIVELVRREPTPSARSRKMIQLQEEANLDVVAAIAWLKNMTCVDKAHIYVSGVSFGGIQTLLTAEKDLGIKAAIPFAPGAMSWAKSPELHERLLTAVRRRTVPVFLIQAANDFSLGPSEVLAAALKESPLPSRAKVYPAYGQTHQEGHGKFALQGRTVWGADVLGFLAELH